MENYKEKKRIEGRREKYRLLYSLSVIQRKLECV